jgi:hypothetical protein
MRSGGEYDGRMGEICKLVQRGQCRDVTIACASDDEAAKVMMDAIKWAHEHGGKGRPLQITRNGFEVIISR